MAHLNRHGNDATMDDEHELQVQPISYRFFSLAATAQITKALKIMLVVAFN